jgi:hypothetical protein
VSFNSASQGRGNGILKSVWSIAHRTYRKYKWWESGHGRREERAADPLGGRQHLHEVGTGQWRGGDPDVEIRKGFYSSFTPPSSSTLRLFVT